MGPNSVINPLAAAADPAAAGRLLRLATYASVTTAVLLILAKLVAWVMTGSVSVLASLVDSAMDAGASLVNLFAVHYATDLATNLATLAALSLAWFGWPGVDPWFGLGIGAYVLYSAMEIGREAVHLLMDQELPDEQRRHIAALAGAVAGAQGVHGLRTRQSGQSLIIQLHLELDDELSLAQAHRITLEAEMAIRTRYPGSDITIHQDPVSLGAESDDLADQEDQAPTERAR